MEDKNKTLFYLHELSDYKVASDYSDVRSWNVKDADNRTVGKVDGLLVNKQAEKVVYLDVQVDTEIIEAGHNVYKTPASKGMHEFLNKDGEDHLIIPIGLVDLDENNKEVHCSEINYQTFTNAKRYAKTTGVNKDYELVAYKHYAGNTVATERTDFDNGFYNQEAFYNRRSRSSL